jgi:hypothetical protein
MNEANDLIARVDELISWIKQGKIIEAMSEFYAHDAAMQENSKPATHGLEANIEREKQFLAQVKEFHGFEALTIGIDHPQGVALIESRMEFTNTQGDRVRLEQVSVQRWKNGKIVHERFYYNATNTD